LVNRRQESPAYVRPNGAIFIAAPEVLRRTRSFIQDGETRASVMNPESSVDVDCESDLIMCEALLSQRGVPPVALSDRLVGDGQPCLVIAEAGVNHNGDEAKAHALVDAAAAAGADVVKFQTFVPEALAARDAPLAPYQRAALRTSDNQLNMLRRLSLPGATYKALHDHAAARGLLFLSSPFDEASADMLERLGVPAFKIPSGELTNHGLLAHVARNGRPLLLSTGMSNLPEVAAAVDAIAAAGDPPLVLLHCVSGYPTPAREANLRAMTTLRAAFGRPVGWSDHTQGEAAILAAVALGAAVVEKHLTLDRGLPGPDHSASMEPAEFRRLVHALREAEAALGSGIKVPSAAEAATLSVARRSLYWRSELDAGTVLSADHVVALRPAGGLAPALLPELVGRRLRRRVAADRPVELDDLEPRE
jgi:N-acetylneuraminate synthase/N,N'-diacetyllegionaminate synthase